MQRVGAKSGLSDYANNTRAIVADRQGHLWFCTGGFGVIRYDGKSFKRFTVAVDAFAGTALQGDDRTVVVVGITD